MRCACNHRCCQQRAELLGLKRGDLVDEAQMEARQSSKHKAAQPLQPAKRKPFLPPRPLVKQQQSDVAESKYEPLPLTQSSQQPKPWTVVPLEAGWRRAEDERRDSGQQSTQLPPAARLARMGASPGPERATVCLDMDEDDDWALPSLALPPSQTDTAAPSQPPVRPPPLSTTRIASSSAPYPTATRSGLFDAYTPQPSTAQQQSTALTRYQPQHQPAQPPPHIPHTRTQPSALPAADSEQPYSRSPSVRRDNPFTSSSSAARHSCGLSASPFVFDIMQEPLSVNPLSTTTSRPTAHTRQADSRFGYGESSDVALKGVNMDMRPSRYRHSAAFDARGDSSDQRLVNASSQRVYAPAIDSEAIYEYELQAESRAQLLRDAVDQAAASLGEQRQGSRRRARSPLSPSDYRRAAAYPASLPRYSEYARERGRRAERRDGDLYYEQRDGGHETDRPYQRHSAYGRRGEEESERGRGGRSVFGRYSRDADAHYSPPRLSQYDDEDAPLYPPPGRSVGEYCASGEGRSSEWWQGASGGRCG